MRTTNGIRCDAEIGRIGHWHICQRNASVQFTVRVSSQSVMTGTLDYCPDHVNHANEYNVIASHEIAR